MCWRVATQRTGRMEKQKQFQTIFVNISLHMLPVS